MTQATCSGGVVTTPTVVLAGTPPGSSYVVDPPGPYDGTVDTTVTVTATLVDGFAWGQMPAGWTQVDLVTATFTVTLVGDDVRRCDAGGAVGDTGGVHRRVDHHAQHHAGGHRRDHLHVEPAGVPAGAYQASPAQSVTVTATLTDTGVAWPASLPDGWTRTSATTATFTVELPNITCVPTQPVGPFVTQASCVDGVVTAPTIDLATTSPGISYVVSPPGPYDGTKTTTPTSW